MKLSIVIVDDHPVIMHGLKNFLAQEHGFTVVGEAEEGRTALELIAAQKPDIVILDIGLEGLDGISLIAHFAEVSPKSKIVMYSTHDNKNYISRAIQVGASGYVLKSEKLQEVINAIHGVIGGGVHLSPTIPSSILGEIIRGGAGTDGAAVSNLTSREYEVASLIAQGLKPQEVAETLFISPKTVRVHRTKIMHKLSCNNVHDLLLQLRQHFPQK